MTYNPGPPGPPYDQQPPVVPGSPGPSYGAPPGMPPKKTSTGKILLIVFGSLAGLCLFGGFVIAALSSGSKSHSLAGPGAKTVSTGAAGATTADDPTPQAESKTPKASDFKLTPKITRKHCFGDAGCNVDYDVNLEYSGPTLDDSDTWVITYEATGDESGPVTSQIEVTGTKYTGENQSVSTASSSTKIKIKVTDIEKQ